MDYDQWCKALDRLFVPRFHGLTKDDFDDWLWWENYNFGLTPLEAYRKWALETFA